MWGKQEEKEKKKNKYLSPEITFTLFFNAKPEIFQLELAEGLRARTHLG